jgi:hypothetical protein
MTREIQDMPDQIVDDFRLFCARCNTSLVGVPQHMNFYLDEETTQADGETPTVPASEDTGPILVEWYCDACAEACHERMAIMSAFVALLIADLEDSVLQ